ncbi:MAG: nuclear transport factor 2 family protein [Gemmatimonadaceae bacterium]|nr:nuclear transport factor 2 family protein [Gemmatimonadaceae bacterium]
MHDDAAIIRGLYAAFAAGNVPDVLGAMTADVHWTEAEGGPYGGVYVGPAAVLDGVFMKLGTEWDGFAAVPEQIVGTTETIVALGNYSATYKATGKSFTAPFAHAWTLADGKVVKFQQYTDTVVHRRPMQ